jgi:hypothetical protein
MALLEPIVKPKFNCSILTLLEGGDVMINHFETNLAALAAQNSNFTPALVTGLRTTQATLAALPNNATRATAHTAERQELVPLSDQARAKYLLLTGYIKTAFPLTANAMLNQAGYPDYIQFKNNNWEHLVKAMNTGSQFIAANAAALQTPGGMPIAFRAEFEDLSDAYHAKADAFETARQTTAAQNATMRRLNAFYDSLIQYGELAKQIFVADASLRKQFTWAAIVSLLHPTGSGSLTLEVDADGTFQPVGAARIVIQKSGEPAINGLSDAQGHADIAHAPNGDYRVTVTCEGFNVFQTTKTIHGHSRIKILLNPKHLTCSKHTTKAPFAHRRTGLSASRLAPEHFLNVLC